MTLSLGSQTYQVDFGRMVQQNTHTGFARAVQRLVAGIPTPAGSASGEWRGGADSRVRCGRLLLTVRVPCPRVLVHVRRRKCGSGVVVAR